MRDRLAELKQINPATANDIEKQPTSAPLIISADVQQQTNQLAIFFDEVSQIRNNLAVLKTQVQAIEELQNSLLNAMSAEKEKTTHAELERKMEMCNKLATDIRNSLKSMENQNKKLEKSQPTSSDNRIRAAQFNTLTNKYVEVMNDFREIQVMYKNKYKQKLQRQLLIGK